MNELIDRSGKKNLKGYAYIYTPPNPHTPEQKGKKKKT